jgi:hypothetical protein
LENNIYALPMAISSAETIDIANVLGKHRYTMPARLGIDSLRERPKAALRKARED